MDKIAFVFAGQGAQSVGMGRELYGHSPAARRVFDDGEKAMPGVRGLCFEGPADQLMKTINAQPCLFLTGLACAAALSERGVIASGAAGFSLGEVPAVCFVGIMAFDQAFAFVRKRAEAMRLCAEQNPGEMYAVLRLSAEDVEAVCVKLDRAWPVNYNSPGQTVVACAADASEALKKAVAEAGGRAVKLAVSGAFHSPFMERAAADLSGYLAAESFAVPKIPLYANLTGKPYGDAKALLTAQINSPVRWQAAVENMISDGFDTFVEVGPGATLAGLIAKISKEARVFSVNDVKTLDAATEALL